MKNLYNFTELPNSLWERVEPVSAPLQRKQPGGSPATPLRKLLNGIIYRFETVSDLGPPHTTSYAPYSGNFSAAALESADGSVVAGRYAVNAAYNPGMSPLQAALVMYATAGHDFARIKRAVLVQTNPDTANQKDASLNILSALGKRGILEVFTARHE